MVTCKTCKPCNICLSVAGQVRADPDFHADSSGGCIRPSAPVLPQFQGHPRLHRGPRQLQDPHPLLEPPELLRAASIRQLLRHSHHGHPRQSASLLQHILLCCRFQKS